MPVPTKTLILFPTLMEKQLAQQTLQELLKPEPQNDTSTEAIKVEVCGFGPIASAALTSELLLKHQPLRVFLVGIAGGYSDDGDTEMLIGSACTFSSVSVDGVGVGSGDDFQSAQEMGWQQFAGDEQRDPIGETIQLSNDSPHRLLTVCASSATPTEATRRRQRFQSNAEDMEGYSVALACKLQNVPLQIIRGISNRAGDRDKSNWKIADAMHAAMKLLVTEIKTPLREI